MLASIFPSQFPNLELSVKWLLASSTFSSGVLGFGEPLIWLGWTLEFEFLFYLVFGLALLSRSAILAGVLTFITFLAMVLTMGINLIVFEFCFGILAAIIFHKVKISFLFAKIISFIGATTLIISQVLELTHWNRLIVWGIPSFLLVLGLSSLKQTKHTLVIKLGNSSYSAYLIQIFTIPILFQAVSSLNFHFYSGDALVVMVVLLTILSGLLMYELAEKKVTKYLNKRVLSIS